MAQAASGEGFRRKGGLGEESWSVGLNGALKDGLTEKGVPSTQGHEERHKGGTGTAAATTWANSVQTVHSTLLSRAQAPSLRGPGAMGMWG